MRESSKRRLKEKKRMSNFVLEISALNKTFLQKKGGNIHAVKNLSLKLKPGVIYGFLGPNGAGKTTTIRCALGLLPFDSGRVRFFGKEPKRRKDVFSRVGYCPDSFSLPGQLTAFEILSYFAGLSGLLKKGAHDQVEKWIEKLGLGQVKNRQVKTLSLGNKQKLLIAQSLIHDPALLFLDEPTSGLDPMAVKSLRSLLKEEKEKGVTIFLNSHQLAQVEKICDFVGIINQGEMITESTLEELESLGGVEKYFIHVVTGGRSV